MYSRILVALDGSPNAEHALPAAIAISRRVNAPIHLVRVHEPSPSAFMTRGRADELSRREEREYLHTVAARAIACGARAVDVALTDGWAPAAIEREISRLGADLVVMTDHGRTGRGGRCLGSVTGSVVRHSEVPVLVARASARPADLAHGVVFRNVLVAIEDADADADVAEQAARLGALGGARYTLLHVVRPALVPIHPYAYAALPTALDAGGTRARVSSTRDGLVMLASRIRDRAGPNGIDIAISVSEHPATAIVDATADHSVDLVAMSSRGCGVSRFISGSVDEHVICATTLPILMCHTSTVEERAV